MRYLLHIRVISYSFLSLPKYHTSDKRQTKQCPTGPMSTGTMISATLFFWTYTDLLTSLTRVFSQPAANIYSSSEHLEHPIVIINSFRPVRCHWLKVIGMSEHCELVPASLRASEAKTSLYRHHGHTAETCHVRDTARPPQPVCLPVYTYLLSSPQKFSKKLSVLMY